MKIKLLLPLSILTTMILTNGCSDHSEHDAHDEHSAKKHAVHWGYTGHEAPKHWGALSPEYSTCSTGRMQTPINIIPTQDADNTPLEFNYVTSATSVVNNGHTVQVNIAPGSNVMIDGLAYELKQFHFHTPSENNINSHTFPLEAHFVHATPDGKLAVVAVMFTRGRDNPMIEKIWSKFPLYINEPVKMELTSNNIQSIMPRDKDYYKFMGSLTTPPCSENVKWNVLKIAMPISTEQVDKFFRVFGHTNNRPIQPSNGRVISE